MSSLIACIGMVCVGMACGDDGKGTDEAGDGTQVCEPGSVSDCACTDGSMSVQTCDAEGASYGECACESAETSGGQDTSTTGTGTTDTSTDTSSSSSSTDTSTDTGTDTSTDTTEGPIGAAPVPEIYHPGDGEVRKVDVAIPWIGVASDAEDGDLSGMSLVWSSDLDGDIGTGLMFDAALSTVGTHVISLTATDSDAQQGVVTIQLTIEP